VLRTNSTFLNQLNRNKIELNQKIKLIQQLRYQLVQNRHTQKSTMSSQAEILTGKTRYNSCHR